MTTDAASVDRLLKLLASAVRSIDTSGVRYKSKKPPYREYGAGVGPFSETVLCQLIADHLSKDQLAECAGACTKRFPDLLIPGRWAIELKLARPFGDNDREAEHWSQNLLHPYAGNTSSLSDAMKLTGYAGPELPVVVVIGYEHDPARLCLNPLIDSFEAIARGVLKLPIGDRRTAEVRGLTHPVHKVARLWGWPIRASQQNPSVGQ